MANQSIEDTSNLKTGSNKTEHVHGTLEYHCPPNCTLEQSIAQAASFYGISPQRLACLVRRESTNNPYAYNSAGPYMGYTQFSWGAWSLTPYVIYSPYNGWANIHAAAYLISRGQGSRWPVWSYC